MIKKHPLFFLVLSFLFLMNSCSEKVFYEKIDHIDGEVWHIDSVLHYEIEITDSLQYYNMYIDIRNTVDFETQYFYVFMTTEFPSGYTGTDTLGFIISDPYGKWTGIGSGRIKDNRFLYRPKVRFAHKGVYKFSVVQGMREDEVKGVADFGMTWLYYEGD